MSSFQKELKNISEVTGTLIGNSAVKNIQDATDVTIRDMDFLRYAVSSKANVDFDIVKGNLFEYIEAAKFNQKAMMNNSNVHAIVTDAVGRPHDPADIELIQDEEVVRQVQAKFSDAKNAAAASVHMQKDKKYRGMQRLIRKEDHYKDSTTGEETTLLNKARQLAKKASEREGNIFQDEYKDVYDNITDELSYGDISSGGTTIEEIKKAHNNPEKYANAVERKQLAVEMKYSANSMAKASFVTTGVVSGISNMFQVFTNEKELADAIHDVGIDAVESGMRGAATGAISSVIRYEGVKTGSTLLSDSTAATVMAGGMVDAGVALYSYAKGEIDEEGLRDELVDTTAKATTTVLLTKAVSEIMKSAVHPFFPMAVYATSSFVISNTREILKNAKLNKQEYERLAAVLEESTKTAKDYQKKLNEMISNCEKNQIAMLEGFIDSFDYNISTGENYNQALLAIVTFANKAGFTLKHVDFDDFSNAMNSDEVFSLG